MSGESPLSPALQDLIRLLARIGMRPETDAKIGMAWWNRLTEEERREWMHRAGDTGVAADAWAVFKAQR
jgi:hypothetical protein